MHWFCLFWDTFEWSLCMPTLLLLSLVSQVHSTSILSLKMSETVVFLQSCGCLFIATYGKKWLDTDLQSVMIWTVSLTLSWLVQLCVRCACSETYSCLDQFIVYLSTYEWNSTGATNYHAIYWTNPVSPFKGGTAIV